MHQLPPLPLHYSLLVHVRLSLMLLSLLLMSSCILLHVPFICTRGPGLINDSVWDCARWPCCLRPGTLFLFTALLCMCLWIKDRLVKYVGVKNWKLAPPLGERPHAPHKAACWHCKLIKVRMFPFMPALKHLHWKGRSVALPEGKHESMDVGSCIMRASRGWIDSLVLIEPLLLHGFPNKRQKVMVPLRPPAIGP